MKYAKQAHKDFNKALVKFEAFKEGQLKPMIESKSTQFETINKKIDGFLDELGFNIYCEDYILSMVEYVGDVLANETLPSLSYKNDYLSLITLITGHYAKEHKDVISQDFKDVSKTVFKTYEMSSLLDILMGE